MCTNRLFLLVVACWLCFESCTWFAVAPPNAADEQSANENVDPRQVKRDALRAKARQLRRDGKLSESLAVAEQQLALERDYLRW